MDFVTSGPQQTICAAADAQEWNKNHALFQTALMFLDRTDEILTLNTVILLG